MKLVKLKNQEFCEMQDKTETHFIKDCDVFFEHIINNNVNLGTVVNDVLEEHFTIRFRVYNELRHR